jgi:hypothetical protein
MGSMKREQEQEEDRTLAFALFRDAVNFRP